MDDADRAEFERLTRLAPTPQQEAERRKAADERLAEAQAMFNEQQTHARRRARLAQDADWLDG